MECIVFSNDMSLGIADPVHANMFGEEKYSACIDETTVIVDVMKH